MTRPAPQVAILTHASADEYTDINPLSSDGFEEGTLVGAAYALAEDDLVTVDEQTTVWYELTDEGRDYAQQKLPELRLYRHLEEVGSIDVRDISEALDVDEETATIARTNFMRKGYGSIEDGNINCDTEADVGNDEEQEALETLLDGTTPDAIDALLERSLAEEHEETAVRVKLTEKGVEAASESQQSAEDAVGELSSELITTGGWKDVELSSYNVEAAGEPYYGGRSHILRSVADRVRDILVGMGFKEMEGPNADADFWINDALFMPQDHPARTHWDRFTLDVPAADGIDEKLMQRVSETHRNGLGQQSDGYRTSWDEDMARTVALRGHTTSLSMRYLANNDIEPPARYFSVDKVYRNDTLDATHLLEFYQIEGWVMADDVSVRDLMGTFEAFYEQFGITDIEFKPHYNPYTEPSFELFGRHPETGELIEIGNSGIFREEVLEPLGVEHDVMAWGLALERLVMLLYGFDDIRDLHGSASDIDLLRNTQVRYNANR